MSNQEYIPPKYGQDAFNCPHMRCGCYSKQEWFGEFISIEVFDEQSDHILYRAYIPYQESGGERIYAFSFCQRCRLYSIWVNRKLVYPQQNVAPPPSEGMSEEIAQLYQEAANVMQFSPRASAALLRVALERICDECKGQGKDLQSKIKYFVEQGKLSPDVSPMMDLIRKVGNKAAHPAEIDFNENPQVAEWLFELINYVAEEMIIVPEKRKQVSENLKCALESDKEPEEK